MEKRRGTNGFIPARGSGWQMGARPDAIPNAAGGEGGHGAATPDVATHTHPPSTEVIPAPHSQINSHLFHTQHLSDVSGRRR
jgi:hypothetical protein